MRLLDVKPIGALIEYTIKPLIDDAKELLQMCNEKGITSPHLLHKAFQIFVFQQVMSFLQAVVVTGAICYTVLRVLSNSQAMRL